MGPLKKIMKACAGIYVLLNLQNLHKEHFSFENSVSLAYRNSAHSSKFLDNLICAHFIKVDAEEKKTGFFS